MKRITLALLFALAPACFAQTASTQYQHINYGWQQAVTLTTCAAGVSNPNSCVKDYALTLTDPTGKALPAITAVGAMAQASGGSATTLGYLANASAIQATAEER